MRRRAARLRRRAVLVVVLGLLLDGLLVGRLLAIGLLLVDLWCVVGVIVLRGQRRRLGLRNWVCRVWGALIMLPLRLRVAGLGVMWPRVADLLPVLGRLPVVSVRRRAACVAAPSRSVMSATPATRGLCGVRRRLVEWLVVLWVAGGRRSWRRRPVTVRCHVGGLGKEYSALDPNGRRWL